MKYKELAMQRRLVNNVREREAIGLKVSNIGRVERTLKLIIFLKEWHTINECCTHISVSERTIQRYFTMLMNLGFRLETNFGMFYAFRLKNVKEYFEQ
jgi:hypothetical protein